MLLKDPLVSIVLPTKDRAHRLPRAIANCLEQTYPKLELVIVNDGSTDATAEVLSNYQNDPRVRIIDCRRNLRLPTALNVGFAATTGDLLTWTSDDNSYFPNAIEVMVREFMADGGLGFVYADNEKLYEDGNRAPRPMADPLYIIETNCVGACFLYTRDVMDRVGSYSPEMFLAEDYDFFLRVFLAGIKMKHLQRCLYTYAVHSTTLGEIEGHGNVDKQAAKALQMRLNPVRREWIRFRRRLRMLWMHYVKPMVRFINSRSLERWK